jgi:hypothetical protein
MTQESVATQDPEDMDDEQVRKELGLKVRKRKKPAIVSMDAPVARDVKTTLGQLLEDPTKDVFRLLYDSAEQHAQSAQALFEIFLQELMDYNDEPQKPLALMYGSVLFKLAKEYGGDSPLAQEAKKSTKVASPIWAHKRMGNANLSALSAYAQRVVRCCCEESLCWGDTFRQNLRSRDTAGTGLLWGDIIYTRTYTEAQTSNWIESIRKSTMVKCARRVEKDTALVAFAKEQLHHDNKFRKALEKAEKEER